jgi:hypothetical protein
VEFENIPTDGFVLNKGVGGQRHSYGWNARNEYIRVFDPRGFEFEISVANLLFILKECDCSRGKGLEGQFVYSWDGTELVLLPAQSEDFKKSQSFTNLQNKKIVAKEMVPGYIYITKKQDKLIFLGKLDYFYLPDEANDKGIKKKFVFWNEEKKEFHYQTGIDNIAEIISDTIVENYAELMDKYNGSPHGSKVVDLFLKDCKKFDSSYRDFWYVEESPGTFIQYYSNNHSKTERSIVKYHSYWMSGETIQSKYIGDTIYEKPRNTFFRIDNNLPWVEPTTLRLFVKLANGKTLPFDPNSYELRRK